MVSGSIVVPYLMSSHPGSRLIDAVELAVYMKKIGLNPEQVQDFYPTPGTASTVMYYTGLDPRTFEPVFVERDIERKREQKSFFFKKSKNIVFNPKKSPNIAGGNHYKKKPKPNKN